MPATPLRESRPRERRRVSLGDLFGADSPGSDVEVSGVTLDSRLVRPGDLYVALPGRTQHGALFAADALGRGAVAVLTDPAGASLAQGLGRPVVVVDDPRREVGRAAAEIFDHPSRALTMYAVTGTNGKTTTACLLEAGLRAAGRTAGLIGTLGFALDGRPLPAQRTTVTTPEAPELQALLARMRDEGADAVVMEVSSHALAIGRTAGIVFDVAAFTNLGRDHLDFHHSEEAYFEAKAALFQPDAARRAVVNTDDPRGVEVAERARRSGLEVGTVSLHDPSADAWAATVQPPTAQPGPGGSPVRGGTVVDARIAGAPLMFVLNLPGDFNVRNALTALLMLHVTGVPLAEAAEGIAAAQVPGRMQRVDLVPPGPYVVVDFAHTPQAVTSALRALPPGRRIVVLGCGGDRDPDKRRPMGEAAAREAAIVVVTDDNPRSEAPEKIRQEILAGARAAGTAARVIDGGPRREAIRLALSLAAPGDAVAVLGKGHETGQESGGQVLPFSDPDVIRDEWLSLQEAR